MRRNKKPWKPSERDWYKFLKKTGIRDRVMRGELSKEPTRGWGSMSDPDEDPNRPAPFYRSPALFPRRKRKRSR